MNTSSNGEEPRERGTGEKKGWGAWRRIRNPEHCDLCVVHGGAGKSSAQESFRSLAGWHDGQEKLSARSWLAITREGDKADVREVEGGASVSEGFVPFQGLRWRCPEAILLAFPSHPRITTREGMSDARNLRGNPVPWWFDVGHSER